jgi:hypothetical protein
METNSYIVNTINDYLDWVKQSRKTVVNEHEGENVSFEHTYVYYRGQTCPDFPIAGIFREPFKGITTEYDILRASKLRLWKELNQYSSFLEKLVFLQHYGMKTRLIDITYNPLIALYFACIPNIAEKESYGVVYYGNLGCNDDERIAKLTAEYIFTHSLHNIDEEIKEFSSKHNSHIWEFALPLVIVPPFSNDRIISQKGAFILTPLICQKGNGPVIACEGTFDMRKPFAEKVAIIPHLRKKELLQALHILGVDKGNVFPDVHGKIDEIIQEMLWNIERINQIMLE